MVGATGGGEGEREVNGHRASVRRDEKALELDGGDGHTTM